MSMMSEKGSGVHDDTRGLRAEPTSYNPPCNICALCGTFDNLSICGGCKGAWYCSKDHQRTHWRDHSSICRHNRTNGGKKRQETEVKTAKTSSETTEQTSSAGDSVTDTAGDDRPTRVTLENVGRETSTCVKQMPDNCHVGLATPTTVSVSEADNTTHLETPQTEEYHKVKDDIPAGPSPRHSGNDDVIPHSERNEEGKPVEEATAPSNDTVNIKGNEPNTKPNDVIPKQSKRRIKKRGKRSSSNKSDGPGGGVSSAAMPEESEDGKTSKVMGPIEHVENPKTFQAHTMREMEGDATTSKSKDGTNPPSPDEVQLVDYVMRSLNNYGLCVVDNFFGEQKSSQVLDDVLGLYKDGTMFCDGQVVHTTNTAEKIRGDKITWVDGNEPGCSSIKSLINRVDGLIISCGKHIKDKVISGRTKAMVACYPGQGASYKRHVDNPNGDGRCLTVIYYINRNWDIKTHGGLLRIFPRNFQQVADIEPKLDRLLFFWSDRRNPHEVHPAFRTRFAITMWYFDKDERIDALRRKQR